MTEADKLSSKIQSERHLQTFLLGLISLGLSLAIIMLMFMYNGQSKLRDEQKVDGKHIVEIATNQTAIKQRMEDLSVDRYTATQAVADHRLINRDINELTKSVESLDGRVRAVEQKID